MKQESARGVYIGRYALSSVIAGLICVSMIFLGMYKLFSKVVISELGLADAHPRYTGVMQLVFAAGATILLLTGISGYYYLRNYRMSVFRRINFEQSAWSANQSGPPVTFRAFWIDPSQCSHVPSDYIKIGLREAPNPLSNDEATNVPPPVRTSYADLLRREMILAAQHDGFDPRNN